MLSLVTLMECISNDLVVQLQLKQLTEASKIVVARDVAGFSLHDALQPAL